ncbi:MAG: 4Fe-4S dicluster domain-containing protein [Deltaproteobacteria bacterium]|nr:MAG: 4Fe-4S dicluster domain-containing protein [Deltaproteobacteria bacterium]
MQSYRTKIFEIALQLLVERQVDAVLGFRRGTIPMMSQPILISSPDEVDQLHWDSFCSSNLANYLPRRKDRVAVFAKGCDSRNIILQILENQIKREQLYIIGVPCQGMVDRRKVLAALDGREPADVSERNGMIRVSGWNFKENFSRDEYLQENCAICTHRNPVIYDELAAEPTNEQREVDRYGDIHALEAMNDDDRWQHFEEILTPCIRCYACRNACPMCYCPTCFVDESTPQWLGKSIDPIDTRTFHFLRAFHLAGRCTDCGNCERACPMGIKVRQLTKKLEKDIKQLYAYEAGLSLDEPPPLDTYRPDDPQEFIR